MPEDNVINEKGELKGLGVLISPEGLIMFPIAIIFDVATFICAILIVFYGIGYAAGLIVDIIALFVFVPWSLIRSQFKKALEVETEEPSGVEEEREPSLPQQPERETGKEEASKTGKTTQAEEETLKAEGEATKATRGEKKQLKQQKQREEEK